MKTTQTNSTMYAFFGLSGSGKTTALFHYLCKQLLDERHASDISPHPQRKYEVISYNRFNAGAQNECEQLCKVIDVSCNIPQATDDFLHFPFVAGKTYFIDTSGENTPQAARDFFAQMSGTYFITIPAFIDTAVLGDCMQPFAFIKNPQIVLTFCDYVSDEKCTAVIKWLTENGYTVAARSYSAKIPRGFRMMTE